ncbi:MULTISPECIES: hypothetical protein [Mycobacterium avium complex (MAC)]|jgi:hypothetical protein|uniref:DUF4190 domain-containing protein n=3 Tax=Mycobacterium avium complex (MAC) TaxID=120793 RepID=A0AAW5SD75_MYCBC|nr:MULTISPECIES: hypothetical protein [Mycobacterium avium complex (MAC)]MCV6992691.1 hypothetical protein [Mycobacterium bouchedurhonense]TXA41116.1 hypothetical protein DKM27_15230 [Mycobacterium tuberculosis variant bovis]APT13371.1 hypothetical protein BS641_26380 [Mycobacterium avium subsp. hominissuis]AXO25374.1 hypothetical protein DFS55_24500 [Mycobacterium avium subsp. hominissuis]MBG0726773.1 hypothetical protein [Mycobacterium avium]
MPVDGAPSAQLNGRYGPLSFLVTLAHILVIDFATWLFMPWLILVLLAVPVLLAYAVIGAFVARGRGKTGQIGRGMLWGSVSAPLSVLIFVPVWLIAQAIGPI